MLLKTRGTGCQNGDGGALGGCSWAKQKPSRNGSISVNICKYCRHIAYFCIHICKWMWIWKYLWISNNINIFGGFAHPFIRFYQLLWWFFPRVWTHPKKLSFRWPSRQGYWSLQKNMVDGAAEAWEFLNTKLRWNLPTFIHGVCLPAFTPNPFIRGW